MSEKIPDDDEAPTSDLIEVSGNILTQVNWKVAAFLFIISIVIFSDLFVEMFLEDTSLAVGNSPTSEGTFVQITTMVAGYIIVDLLVSYGVV